MRKFFSKKQIFTFFFSLIITFSVGFFVWSIYFKSGNNILNEVAALSFSQSPNAENIIPAVSPEAVEVKTVKDIENIQKVLAPVVSPPPQESREDQLDDIQEKLDVIKAKVEALIAEQNKKNQLADADKNKELDNENDQKITTNNTGGGVNPTVYPKILISEVKIAEKTGDKNIFVELYNPNSIDVDLTGWYIFRNASSFITKTLLQGKIIPANGYFLIAETDSDWVNNADLLFDGTLNDDDDISLKNPHEDVADEVSWSQIDTRLSFGRKWNSENSMEQDFELQTPTPRAQNITYVTPPAPAPLPTLLSIAITVPASKLVYNIGDALDITGLEITGIYSDGSSNIEPVSPANIRGFDSSKSATGEILTVAVGGQIITYTIDVNDAPASPAPMPSIIIYTISNSVISPNNDGVNDTTDIDWKFSEKVKVNVDLLDANGNAIFKNFYQSDGVTNPRVKTWNGEDSFGNVVADGIYTIKIVITDSAQNSITDTNKTITVDNIT